MASSVVHRHDPQRTPGDPVEVLDASNLYSVASSLTPSSDDIFDTFVDTVEVTKEATVLDNSEESIEKDVPVEGDASAHSSILNSGSSVPPDENSSPAMIENVEENSEFVGVEEKFRHPLEEETVIGGDADVVAATEESAADVLLSDVSLDGIKKKKDKRVSFRGERDADLVSDYVNAPDPWRFADESTMQSVMQAYAHMCLKNNVQPLPKVLESIKKNPAGRQKTGVFDLSGETIDLALIDTLEAIFMRTSFEELNLDSCLTDDELAVALMDLLEYYHMADKLVVSNNPNLQFRGWLAIAKILKNCCIYYFDARGCVLHDQFASLMTRALRCGTSLVTLHLENCSLSGRPTFLFVSALQYSDTVQEIFLGDNKLTPNDMIHLSSALKHGWRIRVLDLRNNPIMDSGASHLLDSIDFDTPLRALVLWNTGLTKQIGKSLSKALVRSRNLETLNLGANDLADETIFVIKEALMNNRSVRRLGLQSSKISDEGCIALAEFLADHPRFLRLDIRNNDIKCGGWLALSHATKMSPSLVRVDMSYDLRDMKHPDTVRDSFKLIHTTCRENMERFEKGTAPQIIEEESTLSMEKPDEAAHDECATDTADITMANNVSGESAEIIVTSPDDAEISHPLRDDIAREIESTAPDYPEFIGSFDGEDASTTCLDIDVPHKKGQPCVLRRSSITSVTATGPLSVCDRLNEELFPLRVVAACHAVAPVIKGRFQISLVRATEKIYQSVQSVLSPTNSQAGTPIGVTTDMVDRGQMVAPPSDGKGIFNWRATFRRGSKDLQQVDLASVQAEGNKSPERGGSLDVISKALS